jgi:hypothetical protein
LSSADVVNHAAAVFSHQVIFSLLVSASITSLPVLEGISLNIYLSLLIGVCCMFQCAFNPCHLCFNTAHTLWFIVEPVLNGPASADFAKQMYVEPAFLLHMTNECN